MFFMCCKAQCINHKIGAFFFLIAVIAHSKDDKNKKRNRECYFTSQVVF